MTAPPKSNEPQPGPPERNPATPADGGVIRLVIVLIAFLAAAELWLNRHFGLRIAELPVLSLLGSAATLAGGLVGKKWLDDNVRARLGAVIRSVLTVPLLAGAWLILAVLMLTVSSVVVISEPGGGSETVRVTAVDAPVSGERQELNAEEGMLRVRVISNPFGRAFRVEAAGYVPGTFVVYPLTGLRLRLGEELARSPSVLFRPGRRALRILADGGVFRVSRVVSADSVEQIASDTAVQGSFLVGRSQPIGRELRAEWERDAAGLGFGEQGVIQIVNVWRNVRPLAVRPALEPYTPLVAEVLFEGTAVARAEVTLGTERLIDVLIPDLPP